MLQMDRRRSNMYTRDVPRGVDVIARWTRKFSLFCYTTTCCIFPFGFDSIVLFIYSIFTVTLEIRTEYLHTYLNLHLRAFIDTIHVLPIFSFSDAACSAQIWIIIVQTSWV